MTSPVMSHNMSASKVRTALSSFADDNHLDEFSRSKDAKESLQKFIEVINDHEYFSNQFDVFASRLMNALERCFLSCKSADDVPLSHLVKREKLWSAFHQLIGFQK